MDCVNLKRQFGKKYRVRYEESYYEEYGPHARTEDPGLMVVPCRNGHIGVWGGNDLAACTNHPGPVANALKALPFTTVVQGGDDGVNVLFDVRHFEEGAQIMKPRTRRRLSEEERERRTKRLAEYWADKRQVTSLRESKDATGAPSVTSQSSLSASG